MRKTGTAENAHIRVASKAKEHAYGRILLPVFLAWLVLAFAFQGLLRQGLGGLLNALIGRLGRVFPYEWPVYAAAEEGLKTAMGLTLCWLVIPAALLLVLFLVLRSKRRRTDPESGTIASLQLLGIMALGLAILIAAALWLLPREPLSATAGLREKAGVLVSELRYGRKTDLPEGDFRGLSSQSRGEESALEITMEEPASYYLRGFTGSIYTGSGFESIDAAARFSREPLGYWLHEGGFYSQEMLTKAAGDLLGQEEACQKIALTVTGARRNYIYAPYELAKSEEELALRRRKAGEEGILAKGLLGERTYSYQATEGKISAALLIAGKMADEEALSEEGKQYQTLEGFYNEMVYREDTLVPDSLRVTLQRVLKEDGPAEGEEHGDYSEVKEKIVYLLNKTCTYSDYLANPWNGLDFIAEFVDGTKTGYDLHFASAAVMMFRYYGIPARYVEGYLVTKDDAERMEAGQPYVLTGKSAHAWAEYYQDGVGWLPFEVLPSYMDRMEKMNEYQDFSSLPRPQNPPEDTPEDQPSEEEERETPEGIDWLLIWEITLCVCIGLVLLFMIGLVAWVFISRRRAGRIKALFDDPDARIAIRSMFSYAMNICAVSGMRIRNGSLYRYEKTMERTFGPELGAAYHEAVEIRQEAVYSTHTMTEEQKDKVRAFQEMIWKRVYEEGSLLERLRLKYIYYL